MTQDARKAEYREPSMWVIVGIGLLAVLGATLIAVSVGTITISPLDTLNVLLDRTLPIDISTSDIADPIIWNIRLPRVLAALGAGAALGVAGAVLQGLFRNPVADPYLVGLSSVASIGVLLGLWLAWTALGPVAGVFGGALVGAIGSGIVLILARNSEGDPSRFILVGVGFGLSVSAVVAATAIAIHDPRIPELSFWFVGSLAAATWGTALWASAFALVALAVVLPLAGRIDVMSLGRASATHLGIDVNRVAVIALAAVGLGVGAAVGAAGLVAFVGLIAGNSARSLVGPHHRRAIVAAAFAGAVLLVAADAIGRLIGGRFEVPVGLVTAAVGGPYLVWLVTRRKVTP
ncbi:MAG: FecCD family ABC transporter permease [Acidimicrobiia bacterium]